jgi:hypothetical protein
MQFYREDFALLSRAERVSRMSRAGPQGGVVRPRDRRLGRVVQMTRRRAAALRAYRAGVLTTRTAFGESDVRDR